MAIVDFNNLKSRFENGDAPVAQDFVDLVDTLGNNANWGNIFGNLTSNTDLNNALLTKMDATRTYTKDEVTALLADLKTDVTDAGYF
jgi:hypothetical protein